MKKSTTPRPVKSDVGALSQDDNNDLQPVSDNPPVPRAESLQELRELIQALDLGAKSWKEIEEILYALPYSDIIAAVTRFNKIDEDPYLPWVVVNRELDTLKSLAQLGRTDAITNLVVIGNDIARFLAAQFPGDPETTPNPFPNDCSIFQKNEDGVTCAEAVKGELSYKELLNLKTKLAELTVGRIMGTDEDFKTFFNPFRALYPNPSDMGGLSLESLTDDSCFRDIAELEENAENEEEPELARRINLIHSHPTGWHD